MVFRTILNKLNRMACGPYFLCLSQCNPIPITILECPSVFAETVLESSATLSDIHIGAFWAGDLVHHTCALVHGYKVWGCCVDRKPLWCRRVQGSMDASNHLSLVWVHCYYVNACRWTSVGSHSPSICAQFSSFWLHIPHHLMIVHWLGSSNVLTTKAICVTRWCKSTVRYWLVCVTFWYTNVVINLSDSAEK